jgi:translation initiation factor 3 subunit B
VFSSGRLLDEWLAWREQVEADLLEQKRELGLPEEQDTADAEAQVIDEITEEILQEKGGGSGVIE